MVPVNLDAFSVFSTVMFGLVLMNGWFAEVFTSTSCLKKFIPFRCSCIFVVAKKHYNLLSISFEKYRTP